MRVWRERPEEVANLLNPAFCCVVLTSSMVGYQTEDEAGIPFPLAFMVLPIVLHRGTRESLPRTARTSMALWLRENAEARLEFPERVIALSPHVREAVLFGTIHAAFTVQPTGRIQTPVGNNDVEHFLTRLHDEARNCVQRARFVGKWLASAGTPQTVLALWGIRP